MRRGFRRTTLAGVLVAVAVLIPTSFWYLSASREVRRQAARLHTRARADLEADVHRDAGRLAHRLDTLRMTESARPFYHYQNLYHDPRGAAQGLAVVPSPLAHGPVDPLIWSHFQIDARGRVSLPTVNEQFPELSAEEGFSVYCTFLAALRSGLILDGETPSDEGRDEPHDDRVLILGGEAWHQYEQADELYASLKAGQGTGEAPPWRPESEAVVIREGPLQWRTLVLGSGPVLAALREVETPSGILVQGFAVATEALLDWLGRSEPGLTLVPLPGSGDTDCAAVVGDTGWQLQADAGPVLEAANASAHQAEVQFRRLFAAGTTAVLLAGLAVVVMVAQADRLAAQRARFAATAAHELRTPLSSLRLYGEMLAEGLGDPTHASRYARRITTEATRLGRVVVNMLDLARLERGAQLVQPGWGDLATVIRQCLERLRPSLEESGVDLVAELPADLPAVRFDADAVCQILHNLLDNAEKHTRGCADRSVRVHLRQHGEHASLVIADQGPGIPAHLARRLFRPFTRSSGATTPSGLGLGLALARSLARAQDGDLRLCPSASEGACFELLLCLHPIGDRGSPMLQQEQHHP